MPNSDDGAMPYAHQDSIKIYYEVTGDPSGHAVVLISGGGAQMLSWHEDFVYRLVSQGLRVVRLDNRDTGLSQRFGGERDVDGGYGLEAMSEDVVRVLNDLGITAAHLVGHSMGGMMAQMVAIRHPERVHSLSLISTIPGRDPRYILHDLPSFDVPPRLSREEVMRLAVQYALADASGRFDPQVDWHRAKAGEAYDRGYAPDGFTRQWAALMRAPDRLGWLQRVSIPAFVFHGREDPVLHWCSAADMAEAMPMAELQIHAEMGHLIPWELWPVLVDGISRTVQRGEEHFAVRQHVASDASDGLM